MVVLALGEHTTLSQRSYNSGAIFQQSIWSAAIASPGGQTHRFGGMIIGIISQALVARDPNVCSAVLTHLDIQYRSLSQVLLSMFSQ